MKAKPAAKATRPAAGKAGHKPKRTKKQEPRIMKISARNVIPGKVLAVIKGMTTAHVRIDIGQGNVITSSITNEAVDDLGLKVGMSVSAVIKSSDVLVATE